MDQFLAILPKTLGRYKLGNNGVYQDMKPCNRIERAYFAGDQSMIVEVRDTGGFTDDFIRTKQYLSLKVGKKTVNKYEVLLLDGHRALLHNDFFGGGNMIEIAWDDRYEIEIKSKFEDFDSLKKFAFEIGSNLTRASSAGAQVK